MYTHNFCHTQPFNEKVGYHVRSRRHENFSFFHENSYWNEKWHITCSQGRYHEKDRVGEDCLLIVFGRKYNPTISPSLQLNAVMFVDFNSNAIFFKR